jgi:hypothetical protein
MVYYESIKGEPKIKSIYEYRCDERLQTKSKEFTRLPYTGLVLELEHLKKEVYYESIKREPKIRGIKIAVIPHKKKKGSLNGARLSCGHS